MMIPPPKGETGIIQNGTIKIPTWLNAPVLGTPIRL